MAPTIVGILTALAASAHATIIDNINGSAQVPENVYYTIAGNDIGWYYTPSASYMLDGIYTDFASTNTATVTPTITVQIQSERPINGGVVLGQGTFQGDSATGGIGGAMFAPVMLTAGTTYFVDFLNINGMGANVGLWQNDASGNPVPSGGATVNLGFDYVDNFTSTGFAVARGDGDLRTGIGINYSDAEPVLNFVGTPEPSTIVIAAAGAACALCHTYWRRRRGRRRLSL